MLDARESASALRDLLRREHGAMADFLLALAEFDARRLWRDLGHGSLFAFLRRELGLSAGAAQYRKTAAELIQRHPEVEAALRDGELCLSSIIELAKVVTDENVREVLPRFFGTSARDAAVVAASIRPVEKAPVRDVVTALPESPHVAPLPAAEHGSSGGSAEPLRTSEASNDMSTSISSHPPAAPALELRDLAPAPPVRDTADPLDGRSARLHVTVSRRFLAKLEAAKDALSHACPGAKAEVILERGLDLLLAEHARRRQAAVRNPRNDAAPRRGDAGHGSVEPPRNDAVRASAGSRNARASGGVPASVRRSVWNRAGGACEWRLESGEVCGATTRLEIDHVVPRARGGPSTLDNCRLLCKPHNQLAARRVFGDEWMDRYARERGGRRAAAPGVMRPPRRRDVPAAPA